jgi:hypothetical protein
MAKKYQQREMAHRVKVETAPNGYSLDVDGNGYMYFTLAELVEGFFTHVGLGIVDYCDEQTMRDLMTACATWPKEGDAIKCAAEQQKTIDTLDQAHKKALNVIKQIKQSNVKLADDLTKTKKRLDFYIEENEKQKKHIFRLENPDAPVEESAPKKNWKKGRIHKDDIVVELPKKIIKVKPGPPIDKPAKVERRGRPPKQATKKDDHEELEKRLREKGVLK